MSGLDSHHHHHHHHHQQPQAQSSSIATPNIMMPPTVSSSSSSLNNQNAWRTPFVLDPSMGSSASLNHNNNNSVQIKNEQFNYHMNGASSSNFLMHSASGNGGLGGNSFGLGQQQQQQSRQNNASGMTGSANSTSALSAAAAAAAATAAAAAMLYPIELGKLDFCIWASACKKIKNMLNTFFSFGKNFLNYIFAEYVNIYRKTSRSVPGVWPFFSSNLTNQKDPKPSCFFNRMHHGD